MSKSGEVITNSNNFFCNPVSIIELMKRDLPTCKCPTFNNYKDHV